MGMADGFDRRIGFMAGTSWPARWEPGSRTVLRGIGAHTDGLCPARRFRGVSRRCDHAGAERRGRYVI
jgi:hypothetical protein